MLYKVTNRVVKCVLSACFGTSRLRNAEPFGDRHVQMILLFSGVLIAYAMRVNLAMAMVAMDDDNAIDWSMLTKSVVISSFFWGYVILQIPGGVLANRFGGKTLLTTAVGVNSVLVIFIPECIRIGGWKLVCACRVVQGLTQGLIFPSVHNLLGKWAPVEEKSRLGAFVYAGPHLGTSLTLTAAGFVAEYFGWQMIFHSVGFIGIVWTILYLHLGSSTPQASTRITAEEREYIQSSLGTLPAKEIKNTPWKEMFSSAPFMALILVHCGQNWGFWTLLSEMPYYMKGVLGVDIKSNGILSSLPYFMTYLLSFAFSMSLDYCQKKQWFTLGVSRKLSNSIAYYGAAVGLIVLSSVPLNFVMVLIVMTITVGVNAGYITGFMLVHIDMAPNFAGAMMGVTNCLANVVSIIAPIVAGAIVKDETDQEAWRMVFGLAALVLIVTNTIFVVYGTSDRQAWDEQTQGEFEEYNSLIEKKIVKVV